MATPTIDSLPPAPKRTDLPATFSQKADAFVAALQPFRDQVVNGIDWQNTTFIATEAAKNAAQSAQSASETARNASQSARDASIAARDKAQDWAEAPIGTQVETGKYSALHWSDQSETYAAAAQSAAGVPSLAGNAGNSLKVNSLEDGVEWGPGLIAEYQEFTASGTWNKDPNAQWVYVEAIGGGGSGVVWRDDGAGSIPVQGGGGGIGTQRLFRAVDLSSSVVITVGSGGASASLISGQVARVDGNQGGQSSFGSHLIAFGGGGDNSKGVSATVATAYTKYANHNLANEYYSAHSVYAGNGGLGSGAGGDSILGGAGGGGAVASTSPGGAGSGGVSQLAGDGGSGSGQYDVDSLATNGQQPGGGGGGAALNVSSSGVSATATSGAGGDGVVRVWQW